MPEIHDHQNEQLYDGDDCLATVTVDFDADVRNRDHTDTAADVVERLRQAVRKEAQAIQDELDTEAEDSDG